MINQAAKLRTLARLQAGMPTTADAYGHGEGDPLITVRAVREGQVDEVELHTFDELAGGRVDPKYRLEAGDILVPARSTMIQVALVPPHLEGAIFNATLIRLRCRPERIAPALLRAYLDHPDGRAQVEAVSQSGTHQLNITVSALGEVEVPLPPLDEQGPLVETLGMSDRAYFAGLEAAERRRRVSQDIIIRKMRGDHGRVGVSA